MVFSTPLFLFFFLTIVLLVYYGMPLRFRNGVLMIASLFFYYWGEQGYTAIMLLSIAIDYTHGLLVQRFQTRGQNRYARLTVASSVFFNLAILFFFKYWDFLARSMQSVGLDWMPVLGISLPIGISFYTFQTMSYTIDVYRGDAKAQKSIVGFGTFVTLFPQLIAGPIIKYKDLDGQLSGRSHSPEKFASGVTRFVAGLAKKLLIANNLGQLWDACRLMGDRELTVATAWLGILAFAFQIYFDFSGYSDMAIGLGRMFGFEFMENFDYPYISKSITEFWRRWHISLSTWFREYLYIPLGGNRCSRARWLLNMLVIWCATGIWHGASCNYLLWGLYFFVLLAAEKLLLGSFLERLPVLLRHVYVMVLVLISWAIFALEDISCMGHYLAAMLGIAGLPLANMLTRYYLLNYLPILLIASLASTPVVITRWRKIHCRWLRVTVLMLGLLACTAYVVAGTYNPFLYFRF